MSHRIAHSALCTRRTALRTRCTAPPAACLQGTLPISLWVRHTARCKVRVRCPLNNARGALHIALRAPHPSLSQRHTVHCIAHCAVCTSEHLGLFCGQTESNVFSWSTNTICGWIFGGRVCFWTSPWSPVSKPFSSVPGGAWSKACWIRAGQRRALSGCVWPVMLISSPGAPGWSRSTAANGLFSYRWVSPRDPTPGHAKAGRTCATRAEILLLLPRTCCCCCTPRPGSGQRALFT